MITFPKQPSEVLDYDIELEDDLPSSDTITGVTKSVSPSGITLASHVIDNTNKLVKIWISGGTNGVKYKVTAVITTAEGRTLEEEFKIKVRDK